VNRPAELKHINWQRQKSGTPPVLVTASELAESQDLSFRTNMYHNSLPDMRDLKKGSWYEKVCGELPPVIQTECGPQAKTFLWKNYEGGWLHLEYLLGKEMASQISLHYELETVFCKVTWDTTMVVDPPSSSSWGEISPLEKIGTSNQWSWNDQWH